jgi:hypothetical protein
MYQKSPNILVAVLIAIMLGGLLSKGLIDILVQCSKSSGIRYNNDGNKKSN